MGLILWVANDHTLRDSFPASNRNQGLGIIDNVQSQLRKINELMHLNEIKMNNSKAEVTLIGYNKQLWKCESHGLPVGDE